MRLGHNLKLLRLQQLQTTLEMLVQVLPQSVDERNTYLDGTIGAAITLIQDAERQLHESIVQEVIT